MPFKPNVARRHRILKARDRVTNWPACEAKLRRRGNVTFWLDEQAAAARQQDPPAEVIILPRASTVPSMDAPGAQSVRDRHICFIAERGRIGRTLVNQVATAVSGSSAFPAAELWPLPFPPNRLTGPAVYGDPEFSYTIPSAPRAVWVPTPVTGA